MKKVLVCMPSCGFIKTETVAALLRMLGESPVQYTYFTPMSCYIHMNRENAAIGAMETDADYLLFIDADMTFPANALNKLLALNKDIASVHYNYRNKDFRSVIGLDVAYDADYQDVKETKPGEPIPLSAIKNPFRAAFCGGGFLLIKTDVFRKLERPFFFFEPETGTKEAVGEDVWFCEKARKAGYEIWIDPSIEMGHIGTTTY